MVQLANLISQIPLIKGSVYLVEKRKIDGVIMRESDPNDAHKYYIFIGISSEGGRTAGVVINTKNSSECIHLAQATYDFLSHDSYADCTTLMKVDSSRLTNHIGAIGQEDLEKITSLIISSPRVKRIDLQAYGIIE